MRERNVWPLSENVRSICRCDFRYSMTMVRRILARQKGRTLGQTEPYIWNRTEGWEWELYVTSLSARVAAKLRGCSGGGRGGGSREEIMVREMKCLMFILELCNSSDEINNGTMLIFFLLSARYTITFLLSAHGAEATIPVCTVQYGT